MAALGGREMRGMLHTDFSDCSFSFEQWSLENGFSPNITNVLRDQGLTEKEALLSLTADDIAQLGLNIGQRRKVEDAVRRLKESQEENVYCYVDMTTSLRDVQPSTDEYYVTADPASEDVVYYGPELSAILNRPLPALPVNETQTTPAERAGVAEEESCKSSGNPNELTSNEQEQYYSFPIETNLGHGSGQSTPYSLTGYGDMHRGSEMDLTTIGQYTLVSPHATNQNGVNRTGQCSADHRLDGSLPSPGGLEPNPEPCCLQPESDQPSSLWRRQSHEHLNPHEDAKDSPKFKKRNRVSEYLPKPLKNLGKTVPKKFKYLQDKFKVLKDDLTYTSASNQDTSTDRTRWTWGRKKNDYV